MGLKIRLRQQGKTNQHSFRLVLIDEHTKRDGGYLETLGHYDPHHEELVVKGERVQYWLEQGAQPTETATHLIKKGAPEVARAHAERRQVARTKATAKRRARRKKAAV